MKIIPGFIICILLLGCQSKHIDPEVESHQAYTKLKQDGFYTQFRKYRFIVPRDDEYYLVELCSPSVNIFADYIQPDSIHVVDPGHAWRDSLKQSSPAHADDVMQRIVRELSALITFMRQENIHSISSISDAKDSSDYVIDFQYSSDEILQYINRPDSTDSGRDDPNRHVTKYDSNWRFVRYRRNN